MKVPYLMPLGCAIAIFLLVLLPPVGISSGWALVVAILAMVGCHLLHFRSIRIAPKEGHRGYH